MRPESRPPPATYSGGRTPFAWNSPTVPSSGGWETPALTALRADPFRCGETESQRLGPRRSRISVVCVSLSAASMSFPTTKGKRSIPLRSRCDAHGHDSRRSGHDRGTAKTGQSVSQAEGRGAICRPASPNRPHPRSPPSCHPPTPSTGHAPEKSNPSYM